MSCFYQGRRQQTDGSMMEIWEKSISLPYMTMAARHLSVRLAGKNPDNFFYTLHGIRSMGFTNFTPRHGQPAPSKRLQNESMNACSFAERNFKRL